MGRNLASEGNVGLLSVRNTRLNSKQLSFNHHSQKLPQKNNRSRDRKKSLENGAENVFSEASKQAIKEISRLGPINIPIFRFIPKFNLTLHII